MNSKDRAAILFDKFPKLLEGYSLSMKLTDIFNKKSGPDEARLNLARWYNEVESLTIWVQQGARYLFKP